MAKGSMREAMPMAAGFIDYLRREFGTEYIDGIIRAGMAGEPVFYASENGHTVGTPLAVREQTSGEQQELNAMERRWEKMKGER